MRDLLFLAVQLVVTLAKLARPGAVRSVIAESLLLKHQLMISGRYRRRAPPLTTFDRFVLALVTLFVRPRRVAKVAAILKPATLLRFHKALVDRKYRLLFSSVGTRRKPGPKGPTEEVISAILQMKRRNPRFGNQRIAQQISYVFDVHIDSGDLFRCESILLRSHWVLVIIDGLAVCRMFNQAIAGHSLPVRISTDHDPLFRFHRWLANLRILEVEEIKSVPYAPISHPFVERLIGTIRREYLDHTLFWNSVDPHRKLERFGAYYNGVRGHRSLNGTTPANRAGNPSSSAANRAHYVWESHCNGLFETPVAA